MSSNTINDLFNPVGAVEPESKVNTDVYKVSYKDGQNEVYSAVVRFVPFYANPAKNIMRKYTSWVKNPITQKGMYVDDPREVGQPSPVVDLFFELKNTGIATYQDYAKNYLSSKLNCSALVQIINDPQHPNLNGQIKVFTFGKTIWDKIHMEQYPTIPGQAGINPFDPFRGRLFSIYCTNKSGFNNFDNSQFFDNRDANGNLLPSGIWYTNPETGKMECAQDGMNRQYLVDFLTNNSPDLSKYDFQQWTPDQTKHVNETCSIIRGFMSTGRLENPNANTQQAAMNVLQTPTNQPVVFPGASVQPTPTQTPSPVPVSPAGGFASPSASVQTPSAQPVMAAPQTPQPTTGGFAPAPVQQQSVGMTTVAPPQVTPQQPTQGAAPASAVAGINMDDILSQL